jgi:sporulation protein YlmC with PRC-barrel domain
MPRSLKSLLGHRVRARDGEIGELCDILFDDEQWSVRYGVLVSGRWLLARRVLVSPLFFGDVEPRMIHIPLSKETVLNGPDLDADLPVSLKERRLLDGYYGWSGSLAAGGVCPVPFMPPGISDRERAELLFLEEHADPRLRSASEVLRYRIGARDGEIGHVSDFILDLSRWRILGLRARVKHGSKGAQVIIPTGRVRAIRWESRSVMVDLLRDSLTGSREVSRGATFHEQ